jgi:hypothetical protein
MTIQDAKNWKNADDAFAIAGNYQFKTPDGKLIYQIKGLEATDAQIADEIAATRPWMVKDALPPSRPETVQAANTAPQTATYDELTDPANRAQLAKMLAEKPDELDAIRNAHRTARSKLQALTALALVCLTGCTHWGKASCFGKDGMLSAEFNITHNHGAKEPPKWPISTSPLPGSASKPSPPAEPEPARSERPPSH